MATFSSTWGPVPKLYLTGPPLLGATGPHLLPPLSTAAHPSVLPLTLLHPPSLPGLLWVGDLVSPDTWLCHPQGLWIPPGSSLVPLSGHLSRALDPQSETQDPGPHLHAE